MSIIDGESPTSTALTLFLVQLVIIVVLCRFLAYFFRYIKQPSVIAEVVAGILLGPSAFGKDPDFTKKLFPKASVSGVLYVFANIGLIVFMFLVGLELNPGLLKRNARNSVVISLVAMIAPFCLGLAASVAIYKELIPDSVRFSSFLLFVAVALSITAFPVLARILAETRMLDDRVGNIALSSAAVDDVVAWCLLALVVALARATNALSALYTFLVLVGFLLFMFFGMRPVLVKLADKAHTRHTLKLQVIALLLVLMFACAWFTEVIGVHAIFGAFVLGVITPRENRFAVDITERIEDLVVIILLPLYFTYSGLRTDLGSINDAKAGGLLILIIFVACIGKIGGATLAARFCRNTWRDSFTVGVLMNTKGLVELIVLNLGLDVGVLTEQVFTMFVVMALVTTFLTTPLVHYIYLRYRDQSGAQKENYSMVLFTADQRAGVDMVSFASTVWQPNTTTIKAILFNEISDRPSSYFFHLSNKLKQDVPFFKDKAKKDVLHTVKKSGQRYGINVKTKALNSVHVEEDVCSTAEHHICEMILVGINANLEEGFTRFVAPAQLHSGISVAQIIEHGLGQFVGTESPTGRVVLAALKGVNTQLGVYICKAAGGASVHRVAFFYTSGEPEASAFSVILKMHSTIHIDIFAPEKNDVDFDHSAHPNINVASYEDPAKSLVEAARETVYDLVVLGSKRSGLIVEAVQVVKNVNANTLIVFPPLSTGGVPFQSDLEKV